MLLVELATERMIIDTIWVSALQHLVPGLSPVGSSGRCQVGGCGTVPKQYSSDGVNLQVSRRYHTQPYCIQLAVSVGRQSHRLWYRQAMFSCRGDTLPALDTYSRPWTHF